MHKIALLSFCALLAACGDARSQGPAQAAAAGAPVETQPANAPTQRPAFAGQTRAPGVDSRAAYKVDLVASGFNHPWAVAFLPDGRMLVSEREGRLNLLSADGGTRTAVAGLPPTDARRQGGLLDVVLAPDFARSGQIYWCYAEKGEGDLNGTAAARGRLVLQGPPRLEQVQRVFSQEPKLASQLHYGCRFAFPDDGTFFLTLGERSILEGRRQAQRLDGLLGKVVRLNLDGSIPRNNPFVGKQARPEIWSYGHRNIQSAAINPASGALWLVEHGARGGDELNAPKAGRDYGWPTITYGIEYAGGPIGEGITQKTGMEQPLYYWDPVIGPSGMAFYSGRLFPEWKGSLFIGSLRQTHLVRLVLNGERVAGEERLLTEVGKRIRDVREGPDGALYVLTDEDNGQLLRISPR